MPNWSNALSGALSGAASGATAGAALSGIGALPGAIGGGFLGALPALFESSPQPMQRRNPGQYGGNQGPQGNFFTGYEGYGQQFPIYTPQQEQMLNALLSQGMGNLNFGNIEKEAINRFQTQTIPSIAERFTALGGGQRSSAFQGALGQAGAGLENQLGALRAQYGLQQLGLGLQPRFQTAYQPGEAGAGGQILGTGLETLIKFLPQIVEAYNKSKALPQAQPTAGAQ